MLVLGAGGYVGRVVAARIATEPGLRPLAGLHRPSATATGIETRVIEATDTQAVAAALQGCAAVVNAVGGKPATMLAATRALCRAASGAGGVRLVHVSSMAVYGGDASGLVAEDAPFAAAPSAYEAAKIACEAEIRAYARRHPAVILRPGLVFGAGSAQWATRIARLLRARRLGDLGPAGDGFCNLTHQADLGEAVVASMLSPDAPGRAFNIATAGPPTWNEFLIAFARAVGAVPVRRLTARRLWLETRALAPLLQTARLLGARAGLPAGRVPDPIPRSLSRLFSQRMRLDPALTDRLLHITRTSDAAGIAVAGLALRL